ncbi:hypothetical protein GGR56DRAFT_370330 [Xylariaceae sp. FL0804]|nr:hypothetical protein GGR56DRAFT_370330 [Xylariaceae sp. FL0804]
MQKLLRRVATAERVAAKRKKAMDVTIYKREKKEALKELQGQLRSARDDFISAKQSIKDDWARGPLAPRRDVGHLADTHGAIAQERIRPGMAEVISQRKLEKRCEWAGGLERLCLAVSDRVVLLDGPDKGRIGLVQDIDKNLAVMTVQGLNKSNIRVSSAMVAPGETATVNLEMALPISAVRLVHPLRDPDTGLARDVIVNQLVPRDYVRDRVSGERRWQRVVPGLNVSIPWPARDDDSETVPEHHGVDTPRIEVEARTFVPTLLRPPAPLPVLDELRNRYSRFRTRHEPEYVARVEAEEAAARARAASVATMRTPLQEFHRAERESRKKKGKPRLTLEMLERIGEVMARNRERILNNSNNSNSNTSNSIKVGALGSGGSTSTTPTPPPPGRLLEDAVTEQASRETPPPPPPPPSAT